MAQRKILRTGRLSDYDGNRSRFNLASTLTFTVVSSRRFQIWRFFLHASANHRKRFGGPHVTRVPLMVH